MTPLNADLMIGFDPPTQSHGQRPVEIADHDPVAAGALVVAIPIIVLFMIANCWLVSELIPGSVKE